MTKPLLISDFHSKRGQLPHMEDPGATYFVTMCLIRPAPLDLTQADTGQIILEALRHYDRVRYYLFDYTIMPDHTHMILKPISTGRTSYHLQRILQDLKRWTARQINVTVGRRGEVWQVEGFDHIVRNREDYEEKARYIFWNPQKAGLTDDPALWPWWGRGSGAHL